MRHRIWIGYDPREHAAFDVAARSLLRRTDPDAVEIVPLMLASVSGVMNRPIEQRDGRMWCPISQAPMATEFAISRFAVPFLYEGVSLFVDCDVVFLADIRELFALADERYAVQVVKHDYRSSEYMKMDGQVQTSYARKNWSSVCLWNGSHPANKRLTRDGLIGWPGRDLHAFKWLHDDEIGELPADWNYLVGCNSLLGNEQYQAKLLHYTLGGPWIHGWGGGPLDDIWLNEANRSKEARTPQTV